MNKTDLLFLMLEHPENYDDNQWQEILADEECRELYTMMSKTQSVYNLQREVSDEEIDSEWNRLTKGNSTHTTMRKFTLSYKASAMFAGIIMLSSIAVAAIINLIPNNSRHEDNSEYIQHADTTRTHSTGPSDTKVADTIVLDNVSLKDMVQQIAYFYNIEVDIQNDKADELRFYFVWKQHDDITTVMEQLNQFESVNIVIEDNKIIVK